jgi:hypothetical protein
LIADDRADMAGLQAAWARIAGAREPEHQGDAAELAARLALRQGDPARARAEAERAADIRRTLLDYRSLARSLALAARAAALPEIGRPPPTFICAPAAARRRTTKNQPSAGSTRRSGSAGTDADPIGTRRPDRPRPQR